MSAPITRILNDKNSPLRFIASWLLMAFVGLAIASCGTKGGGIEPTSGHHDDTLKVVKVSQDLSELTSEPGNWVNSDGPFRTTLFVRFNKPVDTTTFNRITFKYTVTGQGGSSGVLMTGEFQSNGDDTIVGFESDKSLSEYLGRPVGPGENFDHQLQLRGSHGAITDNDGNIWPFSGIYSKPDPNPLTPVLIRPKSKLLDGDDDDEPGGSFLKDWIVIG